LHKIPTISSCGIALSSIYSVLKEELPQLRKSSSLCLSFLQGLTTIPAGLFGNLQHNHKSNPCPEPQEKLNKLVEAADKADNNKQTRASQTILACLWV